MGHAKIKKARASPELETALDTLKGVPVPSKTERAEVHNRRLQDVYTSLRTAGRITQRIYAHGNKLGLDDLHSLRAAASQANQATRELDRLLGALEQGVQ